MAGEILLKCLKFYLASLQWLLVTPPPLFPSFCWVKLGIGVIFWPGDVTVCDGRQQTVISLCRGSQEQRGDVKIRLPLSLSLSYSHSLSLSPIRVIEKGLTRDSCPWRACRGLEGFRVSRKPLGPGMKVPVTMAGCSILFSTSRGGVGGGGGDSDILEEIFGW